MSQNDFEKRLVAGIDQIRRKDKVLARVIDAVGPCKIQPHSQYYQELVDSIISQQLSVKAAATIVGRFEKLGSGKFPTPEEVLALPEEKLREVGLSRAKSVYVKDLAQHVVDGRLDINNLTQLSNEEIIVELTDIKGIGEWTAHMFSDF